MQLKEEKDKYTITFSKDELLILFEFLADFNNHNDNGLKNSLKTVLYDFECVLEAVLEEPFSKNYLNLLKNAEERLDNR